MQNQQSCHSHPLSRSETHHQTQPARRAARTQTLLQALPADRTR